MNHVTQIILWHDNYSRRPVFTVVWANGQRRRSIPTAKKIDSISAIVFELLSAGIVELIPFMGYAIGWHAHRKDHNGKE